MTSGGHSWAHAYPALTDADGLALTIRRSEDRDRVALARLAELDSASPPSGAHLLAEEGGELRAALPLAGGAPIADPFRATADLVALLEMRSAQLAARAARPARAPGRGLRRPGPRGVEGAGLAFAGGHPRR